MPLKEGTSWNAYRIHSSIKMGFIINIFSKTSPSPFLYWADGNTFFVSFRSHRESRPLLQHQTMSYSFRSSRCVHPHHSPVRHGACFAVLFIVVVLTVISTSHCSTIGVEYVSRLLEIKNRERASAAMQVAAAHGVLERFLPSHSASFEFRIVSKEECGGTLSFMIQNHPGLVDWELPKSSLLDAKSFHCKPGQ